MADVIMMHTTVEKAGESRESTAARNQRWKRRLRVNPKLIPLKILVFLSNGANNALYPFFTIHMLDAGLTLTETGIIFVLIPIVGCIGSPIVGAVADRIGNYKKVAVILMLLSVVSYGLLGFGVPWYSSRHVRTAVNLSDIYLSISCQEIHMDYKPLAELPAQDFVDEKILFDNLNLTACSFQCNNDSGVGYCFASSTQEICFDQQEMSSLMMFNVSIPFGVSADRSQFQFSLTNAMNITKVRCEGNQQCFMSCRERRARGGMHVGHKISGNRWTTVILYTICRVVGSTLVSSVMQLLDASTLLMAKQHGGDFGIQRMFGLFGSLLLPVITGRLNDIASEEKGYADYSPSFYLFCLMFALGAVITWFMDLEIKKPQKNVWSEVATLLRSPKVSSFIVVMFVVGCCFGALENYLFWFMKKFLHSPQWLLGMTNTVAGLSAVPVVAASTLIIRWVGHTKIFITSIAMYGVRFLAYSFVYDAYLILPVEVLEAFTFSLTWVAATVYCGKLAPGYLATLQGIVGSMHYSMGRGAGALVAGILFDRYPARLVYQCIAATCFGLSLCYAFIYYAYLRRTPDPFTKDRISSSSSESDETKPTVLEDIQQDLGKEAEQELLRYPAHNANMSEDKPGPLHRPSKRALSENL